MLAKAKTVAPQSFGVRILTDIRGLIFGTGKEIHYIGGTEILPPPLEEDEEQRLISRLVSEKTQRVRRRH